MYIYRREQFRGSSGYSFVWCFALVVVGSVIYLAHAAGCGFWFLLGNCSAHAWKSWGSVEGFFWKLELGLSGLLGLLNHKHAWEHAFVILIRGKSSLIIKTLPVTCSVNWILLFLRVKGFIHGKTWKRGINHRLSVKCCCMQSSLLVCGHLPNRLRHNFTNCVL